jgi:hypothetical protein
MAVAQTSRAQATRVYGGASLNILGGGVRHLWREISIDVLVRLLTFRKSFNLKTPTLANGCITLHYTMLDYFHKNSVFANGYLR